MKRANHLYDRISTHENLREAFRKAAKGKQVHPDVIRFKHRFDENIHDLHSRIIRGTSDIGHYHFFVVRDPKVRLICAASFPERVLPRTRKRFSQKLREYERNVLDGRWSEADLVRHIEPLVAFTDAGDSGPFRRMVIQRFGVWS